MPRFVNQFLLFVFVCVGGGSGVRRGGGRVEGMLLLDGSIVICVGNVVVRWINGDLCRGCCCWMDRWWYVAES